MPWEITKGDCWDVARDCYMPYPALRNELGVSLLYTGSSRHFGGTECFEYQHELIERFVFFASRVSEENIKRDTWNIELNPKMIVPLIKDTLEICSINKTVNVRKKAVKWNGVITTGLIENIRHNIEDAFASHPFWPKISNEQAYLRDNLNIIWIDSEAT